MLLSPRSGQRSGCLAHEQAIDEASRPSARVQEEIAVLLESSQRIRLLQKQVAESLGLPVFTLGRYCFDNERYLRQSALLSFLLHTAEAFRFAIREGRGTLSYQRGRILARCPRAGPRTSDSTTGGENEGMKINLPQKMCAVAAYIRQDESRNPEGEYQPTAENTCSVYAQRPPEKSECNRSSLAVPSRATRTNASVGAAAAVSTRTEPPPTMARTTTKSGDAAVEQAPATTYCSDSAGEGEKRAEEAAPIRGERPQHATRGMVEGLGKLNDGAPNTAYQWMSADREVAATPEVRDLLLDFLRQTFVIVHQPLQFATPRKARRCCTEGLSAATRPRHKSSCSDAKLREGKCSLEASDIRDPTIALREAEKRDDAASATAEEFASRSGVSTTFPSGNSGEGFNSSDSSSVSGLWISPGPTRIEKSTFHRSMRHMMAPSSFRSDTTAPVSSAKGKASRSNTPAGSSWAEERTQIIRTRSNSIMRKQLLRHWTWRVKKPASCPRYNSTVVEAFACKAQKRAAVPQPSVFADGGMQQDVNVSSVPGNARQHVVVDRNKLDGAQPGNNGATPRPIFRGRPCYFTKVTTAPAKGSTAPTPCGGQAGGGSNGSVLPHGAAVPAMVGLLRVPPPASAKLARYSASTLRTRVTSAASSVARATVDCAVADSKRNLEENCSPPTVAPICMPPNPAACATEPSTAATRPLQKAAEDPLFLAAVAATQSTTEPHASTHRTQCSSAGVFHTAVKVVASNATLPAHTGTTLPERSVAAVIPAAAATETVSSYTTSSGLSSAPCMRVASRGNGEICPLRRGRLSSNSQSQIADSSVLLLKTRAIMRTRVWKQLATLLSRHMTEHLVHDCCLFVEERVFLRCLQSSLLEGEDKSPPPPGSDWQTSATAHTCLLKRADVTAMPPVLPFPSCPLTSPSSQESSFLRFTSTAERSLELSSGFPAHCSHSVKPLLLPGDRAASPSRLSGSIARVKESPLSHFLFSEKDSGYSGTSSTFSVSPDPSARLSSSSLPVSSRLFSSNSAICFPPATTPFCSRNFAFSDHSPCASCDSSSSPLCSPSGLCSSSPLHPCPPFAATPRSTSLSKNETFNSATSRGPPRALTDWSAEETSRSLTETGVASSRRWTSAPACIWYARRRSIGTGASAASSCSCKSFPLQALAAAAGTDPRSISAVTSQQQACTPSISTATPLAGMRKWAPFVATASATAPVDPSLISMTERPAFVANAAHIASDSPPHLNAAAVKPSGESATALLEANRRSPSFLSSHLGQRKPFLDPKSGAYSAADAGARNLRQPLEAYPCSVGGTAGLSQSRSTADTLCTAERRKGRHRQECQLYGECSSARKTLFFQICGPPLTVNCINTIKRKQSQTCRAGAAVAVAPSSQSVTHDSFLCRGSGERELRAGSGFSRDTHRGEGKTTQPGHEHGRDHRGERLLQHHKDEAQRRPETRGHRQTSCHQVRQQFQRPARPQGQFEVKERSLCDNSTTVTRCEMQTPIGTVGPAMNELEMPTSRTVLFNCVGRNSDCNSRSGSDSCPHRSGRNASFSEQRGDTNNTECNIISSATRRSASEEASCSCAAKYYRNNESREEENSCNNENEHIQHELPHDTQRIFDEKILMCANRRHASSRLCGATSPSDRAGAVHHGMSRCETGDELRTNDRHRSGTTPQRFRTCFAHGGCDVNRCADLELNAIGLSSSISTTDSTASGHGESSSHDCQREHRGSSNIPSCNSAVHRSTVDSSMTDRDGTVTEWCSNVDHCGGITARSSTGACDSNVKEPTWRDNNPSSKTNNPGGCKSRCRCNARIGSDASSRQFSSSGTLYSSTSERLSISVGRSTRSTAREPDLPSIGRGRMPRESRRFVAARRRERRVLVKRKKRRPLTPPSSAASLSRGATERCTPCLMSCVRGQYERNLDAHPRSTQLQPSPAKGRQLKVTHQEERHKQSANRLQQCTQENVTNKVCRLKVQQQELQASFQHAQRAASRRKEQRAAVQQQMELQTSSRQSRRWKFSSILIARHLIFYRRFFNKRGGLPRYALLNILLQAQQAHPLFNDQLAGPTDRSKPAAADSGGIRAPHLTHVRQTPTPEKPTRCSASRLVNIAKAASLRAINAPPSFGAAKPGAGNQLPKLRSRAASRKTYSMPPVSTTGSWQSYSKAYNIRGEGPVVAPKIDPRKGGSSLGEEQILFRETGHSTVESGTDTGRREKQCGGAAFSKSRNSFQRHSHSDCVPKIETLYPMPLQTASAHGGRRGSGHAAQKRGKRWMLTRRGRRRMFSAAARVLTRFTLFTPHLFDTSLATFGTSGGAAAAMAVAAAIAPIEQAEEPHGKGEQRRRIESIGGNQMQEDTHTRGELPRTRTEEIIQRQRKTEQRVQHAATQEQYQRREQLTSRHQLQEHSSQQGQQEGPQQSTFVTRKKQCSIMASVPQRLRLGECENLAAVDGSQEGVDRADGKRRQRRSVKRNSRLRCSLARLLVPLFEELLKRQQKCNYLELLRSHCPRGHVITIFSLSMAPSYYNRRGMLEQMRCMTFSEVSSSVGPTPLALTMDTPLHQVVNFLQAVLRRVVPPLLVGCRHNFRLLLLRAKQFVLLNTRETFTLHMLLHRMRMHPYSSLFLIKEKRQLDRHGTKERKFLFRRRSPATSVGRAAAGVGMRGSNTLQTDTWSDAPGGCTWKFSTTSQVSPCKQNDGKSVLKSHGGGQNCTKKQRLQRGKNARGKMQEQMTDILKGAPQGEFLARIVYLIFSQLVVPILREHFYITEAEPSLHRPHFFRKIAWLHVETHAGRSFYTRGEWLCTNTFEEGRCHSCRRGQNSTDSSSTRSSRDNNERSRTCLSSYPRSIQYSSTVTGNTSCCRPGERDRNNSSWNVNRGRSATRQNTHNRRSRTERISSSSRWNSNSGGEWNPETRICSHSVGSCLSLRFPGVKTSGYVEMRGEKQSLGRGCNEKKDVCCSLSESETSVHKHCFDSDSCSTFRATVGNSDVVSSMAVCSRSHRDSRRSKRLANTMGNNSDLMKEGSGSSRSRNRSKMNKASFRSYKRGRVSNCNVGGCVTSNSHGTPTGSRELKERKSHAVQRSRNSNIYGGACPTHLHDSSDSVTRNTGASINTASGGVVISENKSNSVSQVGKHVIHGDSDRGSNNGLRTGDGGNSCGTTGTRWRGAKRGRDASSDCLLTPTQAAESKGLTLTLPFPSAADECEETQAPKHSLATRRSRGSYTCGEAVHAGGRTSKRMGLATNPIQTAEELDVGCTSGGEEETIVTLQTTSISRPSQPLPLHCERVRLSNDDPVAVVRRAAGRYLPHRFRSEEECNVTAVHLPPFDSHLVLTSFPLVRFVPKMHACRPLVNLSLPRSGVLLAHLLLESLPRLQRQLECLPPPKKQQMKWHPQQQMQSLQQRRQQQLVSLQQDQEQCGFEESKQHLQVPLRGKEEPKRRPLHKLRGVRTCAQQKMGSLHYTVDTGQRPQPQGVVAPSSPAAPAKQEHAHVVSDNTPHQHRWQLQRRQKLLPQEEEEEHEVRKEQRHREAHPEPGTTESDQQPTALVVGTHEHLWRARELPKDTLQPPHSRQSLQQLQNKGLHNEQQQQGYESIREHIAQQAHKSGHPHQHCLTAKSVMLRRSTITYRAFVQHQLLSFYIADHSNQNNSTSSNRQLSGIKPSCAFPPERQPLKTKQQKLPALGKSGLIQGALGKGMESFAATTSTTTEPGRRCSSFLRHQREQQQHRDSGTVNPPGQRIRGELSPESRPQRAPTPECGVTFLTARRSTGAIHQRRRITTRPAEAAHAYYFKPCNVSHCRAASSSSSLTTEGSLCGPCSAHDGAFFRASLPSAGLAGSVHSGVTSSPAVFRHSPAAQLSINSLTRPLCCYLVAAARLQPKLLQCSVLSLSDIQRRLRCWWKHTRNQVLRAQRILQQLGPAAGVIEALIPSTWFFVVGDLQSCFDSLQHDALLQAVAAAVHLVDNPVDQNKASAVAGGAAVERTSNTSNDISPTRKYTNSGTPSKGKSFTQPPCEAKMSKEDRAMNVIANSRAANRERGGKTHARVTKTRRKEATATCGQLKRAPAKRSRATTKTNPANATAGSVVGDSCSPHALYAPSGTAATGATPASTRKNPRSETPTYAAATAILTPTQENAKSRAGRDGKTMGGIRSRGAVTLSKKRGTNGSEKMKIKRARGIPKQTRTQQDCSPHEEEMSSNMLVMQIYRRIIPPPSVAAASTQGEARFRVTGHSFSMMSRHVSSLKKQLQQEDRQEDKERYQRQDCQGQRQGRPSVFQEEAEAHQQCRLPFPFPRPPVPEKLLQRAGALTNGNAIDGWRGGRSASTGYLEEIAIPAERLLPVGLHDSFTEQVTVFGDKPASPAAYLSVRVERNTASADGAAASEEDDTHEPQKSTISLSAAQSCAAGDAALVGAGVPASGWEEKLLAGQRALPAVSTSVAASEKTDLAECDSVSAKSLFSSLVGQSRRSILGGSLDTVREEPYQNLSRSAAEAVPERLLPPFPFRCLSMLAEAAGSTSSNACGSFLPAPLYGPAASQSISPGGSAGDRQPVRSLFWNALRPGAAHGSAEILSSCAAAVYRRDVLAAAESASAATHAACAPRPSATCATSAGTAAAPSLEVALTKASLTPLFSRGAARNVLIQPAVETVVPASVVPIQRHACRPRLSLWSMLRRRLLRGCCERGCVLVSATQKPLIHVAAADVVTGSRLLLQQHHIRLPRGTNTMRSPVKGNHLSSSVHVASSDRRSTTRSSSSSRRVSSTGCNRRNYDGNSRRTRTSTARNGSSFKTKNVVLKSSRKKRRFGGAHKPCKAQGDDTIVFGSTGKHASGDDGSSNTTSSPRCNSMYSCSLILNNTIRCSSGRGSMDSVRSSSVSSPDNSASPLVKSDGFALGFTCNCTSQRLFRQHVGLPQGSNLSAVLCALYYAQCDRLPPVQALLKESTGQRAMLSRDACVAVATTSTSTTVETAKMKSSRTGKLSIEKEVSPGYRQSPEAAAERSLAVTWNPPARETLPSTTAAAVKKGILEEVPTAGNVNLCLAPNSASGRREHAATAVQMKNAVGESLPSIVHPVLVESAKGEETVTTPLHEDHKLYCQRDKNGDCVRVGPLLLRFDPLLNDAASGLDGRKEEKYIQSGPLRGGSRKNSHKTTHVGSPLNDELIFPSCNVASLGEICEEGSRAETARRGRNDGKEYPKGRELRFAVSSIKRSPVSASQGFPEQQNYVSTETETSSPAHQGRGDLQSLRRVSVVLQQVNAKYTYNHSAPEFAVNERGAAAASAISKALSDDVSTPQIRRVAVNVANSTARSRYAASASFGHGQTAAYLPSTTTNGADRFAARTKPANLTAGTTADTRGICDQLLRHSIATALLCPSSSSCNGLVVQHGTAAAGVQVKDLTAAAPHECSAGAVALCSSRRFAASADRRGPPCTATASPAAVAGFRSELPSGIIAPDRPSDVRAAIPVCTAISFTSPVSPSASVTLPPKPASGATGAGTKACDTSYPGSKSCRSTCTEVDGCIIGIGATAASGAPPPVVRNCARVISASADSIENNPPCPKSISRKKARRQLLRRLSRLRWRPLLLRWVDDFLFISPVLWHAKTFLRLLLQEKVWGANVNKEKLQTNFDAADDVIVEHLSDTFPGSEQRSERPSSSRKNTLTIFSHDTQCRSNSTEQQQPVTPKIRSQINTPEYADLLHQTLTQKEDTSTYKQGTWIPPEETGVNETCTAACRGAYSPIRPTRSTLSRKKRFRSRSVTDRDPDCTSMRKRRYTSSKQVQQPHLNQGQQLRAHPAAEEIQSRRTHHFVPVRRHEDCTSGTERCLNGSSNEVSLDQDILQVSPTGSSFWAEGLGFDHSAFSRNRRERSTSGRSWQKRDSCGREDTVLGQLYCSRSSNGVARRGVTDREEETPDKYACWAGLRLDMAFLQQEGISVMPLITKNPARVEQRRRRGSNLASNVSKMVRRTAYKRNGHRLSSSLSWCTSRLLCDTESKGVCLKGPVRGTSVVSKRNNRRHNLNWDNIHARKRRTRRRSKDEGTRKRRSDTRSCRTAQVLKKQNKNFATRVQTVIRDAVVLQCFRPRGKEPCGFMQALVEQRLLGHLKARVGSTGIFVDTMLNPRSTILRNIYIVYKNVLLRTRCALTRLTKEFAGFVRPSYLIGLCLRLLVYLLFKVRSRVSSASLRCREPLLALQSNAMAATHTGCAGRCCCTTVAASRKQATCAVAPSAMVGTSASPTSSFHAGRIIAGGSCTLRRSLSVQPVFQSSTEFLIENGSGANASAAFSETHSPLESTMRSSPSRFTLSPPLRFQDAATASYWCYCSCSFFSPPRASEKTVQLRPIDTEEAASSLNEAPPKGATRVARASTTVVVNTRASRVNAAGAAHAEEAVQITGRKAAITVDKTPGLQDPTALRTTRIALEAEVAAATQTPPPGGEGVCTATTTGMISNKRTALMGSEFLKESPAIPPKFTASADNSIRKNVSTATSPPRISKPIQPHANTCASFFWQQARLLCFNAAVSVFSLKSVTCAQRQTPSVKTTLIRPDMTQKGRRRLSWRRAAKDRISRLHMIRQKRRKQHEQQHRKKQQQQQPKSGLKEVRDQAALSSPAQLRYISNSGDDTAKEKSGKRAAATAGVRGPVAIDASTRRTSLQLLAADTGGPSWAKSPPRTTSLVKDAAAATGQRRAKNPIIRLWAACRKHSEQHQAGEPQRQAQQQMKPHQETQLQHNLSVQRWKNAQQEEQQSTDLIVYGGEESRQQQAPQQDHCQQQSPVAAHLPRIEDLPHQGAMRMKSGGIETADPYSVEGWKRQNVCVQQRTFTGRQQNFRTQQQKARGNLHQYSVKRREGHRTTDQAFPGQEEEQESDLELQIRQKAPHNEHLSCRTIDKGRKEGVGKKPASRKTDRAANSRLHAFACCSSYFAMLALHPQLLRRQKEQRARCEELHSGVCRRLQERQAGECGQGQQQQTQTSKVHRQHQHQQPRREPQWEVRRRRTRSYCDDGLEGTEVQSANLQTVDCSAEGGETANDSRKKKSAKLVGRKRRAARRTAANQVAAPPVLQRAVDVPLLPTADASFSNGLALSRMIISTTPGNSRKELYDSGNFEGPHVDRALMNRFERRLHEDYGHQISRDGRHNAEDKRENDIRNAAAARPVAEEIVTLFPRDRGRRDQEAVDAGVRLSREEGGTNKDVHIEDSRPSKHEPKMSHSPAPETRGVHTRWGRILHTHRQKILRSTACFSGVDGAEDAHTKALKEQKDMKEDKRGAADEEIGATVAGTIGKPEGNEKMHPVRLAAEKNSTKIRPYAKRNKEKEDEEQDGFNHLTVDTCIAEQSADERETKTCGKANKNVDGNQSARHAAIRKVPCHGGGEGRQGDPKGEGDIHVAFSKVMNGFVRRIPGYSTKQIVDVAFQGGCQQGTADVRPSVKRQKRKITTFCGEPNGKRTKPAQSGDGGDSKERARNILRTCPLAQTPPHPRYFKPRAQGGNGGTEDEGGNWGTEAEVGQNVCRRKKVSRATAYTVRQSEGGNCPSMIDIEGDSRMNADEIDRAHQEVKRNVDASRVLSQHVQDCAKQWGSVEKPDLASETRKVNLFPSAYGKSEESAAPPLERKLWMEMLQYAAARALAFSRSIEETELRQGEGWPPLMRARKRKGSG